MDNDVLVSIVMPAYNAEKHIADAISSVLQQSYSNWELIVVDDGSADNTKSIIQNFCAVDSRVQYHAMHYNAGVATARNCGIGLCRGKYIAFLDCDDIWFPHKLEKQLRQALTTDADLLYSAYVIMDSRGTRVGMHPVSEALDFQMLLRENCIGCSTVMLKDSVAHSYFFTKEYYHEDYVFWLQILRDGHSASGCTEALTAWRLAPNSRSANKIRCAYYRWQIYRKFLCLPLHSCILYFLVYTTRSLGKYCRLGKGGA